MQQPQHQPETRQRRRPERTSTASTARGDSGRSSNRGRTIHDGRRSRTRRSSRGVSNGGTARGSRGNSSSGRSTSSSRGRRQKGTGVGAGRASSAAGTTALVVVMAAMASLSSAAVAAAAAAAPAPSASKRTPISMRTRPATSTLGFFLPAGAWRAEAKTPRGESGGSLGGTRAGVGGNGGSGGGVLSSRGASSAFGAGFTETNAISRRVARRDSGGIDICGGRMWGHVEWKEPLQREQQRRRRRRRRWSGDMVVPAVTDPSPLSSRGPSPLSSSFSSSPFPCSSSSSRPATASWANRGHFFGGSGTRSTGNCFRGGALVPRLAASSADPPSPEGPRDSPSPMTTTGPTAKAVGVVQEGDPSPGAGAATSEGGVGGGGGGKGEGPQQQQQKNKQKKQKKQQPEFSMAALLHAIAPGFYPSPDAGDDGAPASSGGAGRPMPTSSDGGEEGECEDLDGRVTMEAPAGKGVAATAVAASLEVRPGNAGSAGSAGGKEGGNEEGEGRTAGAEVPTLTVESKGVAVAVEEEERIAKEEEKAGEEALESVVTDGGQGGAAAADDKGERGGKEFEESEEAMETGGTGSIGDGGKEKEEEEEEKEGHVKRAITAQEKEVEAKEKDGQAITEGPASVEDEEEQGDKEFQEGSGAAEGEEGMTEEQRRKRDMYKIRSLLLQGQVAGLREKLKERELDVKELRVLTGGRGQSKLRELGAMLKEARADCTALQAREKSLAEELATAQKEGDMLRGDLLANQKALSDLNVYADSLRSRYTAEMVKLEASLAEMERELTRAEASHMRERRELLDREAAAIADQERFRGRSILLQGEVLKARAREKDLSRENARLVETMSTAEAEKERELEDLRRQERESAAQEKEAELEARLSAEAEEVANTPQGQQHRGDKVAEGDAEGKISNRGGGGGAREEEVRFLERENAALREELEALTLSGESGNGGGGPADALSIASHPPPPTSSVDDVGAASGLGRDTGGSESTRGLGWSVPGRPWGAGGFQAEGRRRRALLSWGFSVEEGPREIIPSSSSSAPGGVVDSPAPPIIVDAVVNDSRGAGDVGDVGDVAVGIAAGREAVAVADAAVTADDNDGITDGQNQNPPSVATGASTTGVVPPPPAVAAAAAVAPAAGSISASAGAEADRVYREAGVNRVVEGLRAENARLRKRLRAAEVAAESAENCVAAETERGDAAEAELARLRGVVKGRVKALKGALEEAEEDAERAMAEKEEFMLQWAEDVDALRLQLGAERKAREEDRRELERTIFDLEDELDELKERYRQRKKPGAKKKKRQVPPGDANIRDGRPRGIDADLDGSTRGGEGLGRAPRPVTDLEAEERSAERARKTGSDVKIAEEQWRKAMTLLQYLD